MTTEQAAERPPAWVTAAGRSQRRGPVMNAATRHARAEQAIAVYIRAIQLRAAEIIAQGGPLDEAELRLIKHARDVTRCPPTAAAMFPWRHPGGSVFDLPTHI